MSKKHVVVARFDDKTDALFQKWKNEAYAAQTQLYRDAAAWPPHLTVAAYEDMPVDALCGWACEYAEQHEEIDVQFGSLGVFAHGANMDTDVIYIAPSNSVALTDFYYGFHKKYDEYSGDYGWRYTAAFGQPVFHSTLTICKAEDFHAVFDGLRDKFVGVSGRITALEVYENPIRLAGRYPLKGLYAEEN